MTSGTGVLRTSDDDVLDPTKEPHLKSEFDLSKDIEEIWDELTDGIERRRSSDDKEERYSEEGYFKALATAFEHPDLVSIERVPFSKYEDLDNHIRGHFENLLNDKDYAPRLKRGVADSEKLIKLCELVYIDDAFFRFSEVTAFDPDINGLSRIVFIDLPDSQETVPEIVERWHEEFDLLWKMISGEIPEIKRIDVLIDELYEERMEFVKAAKDENVFLPITTEATGDAEKLRRRIRTYLNRNNNVDPELVHDYCYLQFEEELKK